MMEPEQYILGIDIGTTSVKACVVCVDTCNIANEISVPTEADITNDSRSNEQDVTKIVNSLHRCMGHLEKNILHRVIGIGVCGQVHGIVFWNSNDRPWKAVKLDGETMYEIDSTKVSHLYTWQDRRCDTDFLSTLPKADSHLKAYTGYGCNTLFWLSRNQREKIEKFNCAGTIADFVISMICDLEKPLMSTHNAASWGYFNTKTCEWNKEILLKENFPVNFLPLIAQPEEISGKLDKNWCGIPNVSVGVALGDMQCSVLATIQNIEDAFMNISTSAQLAFVAPHFQPELSHEFPVEYVVPYFNGTYLAVAALLNGGNALATFVRNLQHWFSQLNVSISTDELWKHLSEISANTLHSDSGLTVVPMFLGERFAPEQRASILNITPENFNLGEIFTAICCGIIENFHRLMPQSLLADAGINRIIGSGSALLRNPVLQAQVEKFYKLPVVFKTARDSPFGAAISMINTLNKKTR